MNRDQLGTILFSLLVLIAVVTATAGAKIATVFLACLISSYLTEFYLIRIVAAIIAKRPIQDRTYYVAVLAVAADAVIILFGFPIMLFLLLASVLILDIVILKFR